MRDHSPPQSRLHGRHAARIAAGLFDRGTDQTAPGNHDIVGDGQMTRKTHHTADHAALPDHRAAGYSGAGRDRRMSADDDVVTYLDLIVQFDSVLDNRIVDRAPIDSSVRPALHVVAASHAAHVRPLY